MTKLFRLGTIFSILLVIGACSHAVQIERHADAYNNSVETVENQMLLKNVVRASRRMPLHFTRVSSIKGSLSTSVGSGTLTLPTFGVDGGTITYAASPSVSTSSSPSFTVQALDTDKFFRGVMTPVDIATLQFFVDQGWPLPVLMFMFVESIDVYAGGTTDGPPLCTIDNDPLSSARFDAFQEAILLLMENGDFGEDKSKEPFGPKFTAKGVSVEELVLASEAGLKIAQIDKGASPTFVLQKKKSEDVLLVPFKKISNAIAQAIQLKYGPGIGNGYCAAPDIRVVTDALRAASLSEDGDGDVQISVKLHTRPAINMIYYLGELQRFQRLNDGKALTSWLLCPYGDPDGRPTCTEPKKNSPEYRLVELQNPSTLLTIKETRLDDAAISAEIDGRTYSVPGYPNAGRTTQLLTLVRQIFALNISSDEFPASQTVQLITRSK